MARSRPVYLYLSKNLPDEQAAMRLLSEIPDGERTKFLRHVILLGREAELSDAEARKQALASASPAAKEGHDGPTNVDA